MFIQIIFKRFIALWNSEELISKVHFTSSLKHKDKKKIEMLSKNPKVTREYVMRYQSTSKNP